MKPAPFDYVVPSSIEEALDHLAHGGGDAALLAGGQTLAPLLALRMSMPSLLIDINRIPLLQGIARNGGVTRIAAATRQNDLLICGGLPASLAALGLAASQVGHHQTRNRGTIGGSVALGEPAAELPATAVALDAVIELRSSSSARAVPAREFYVAPYVTSIQLDEMIVSVAFADWPDTTVPVFGELARRPGDFALVGITGALAFVDGRVARAGLAWLGMGETPLHCREAEQALVGLTPAEIDVGAIADLALTGAAPMDDLHATAHYRRSAGRKLFERELAKALAKGSEA